MMRNPMLTFMTLPTINRQLLLVMAINIQQLITGYGIGFSAPCLAQLVDEAVLGENQIAWFASCLVIGQVPGSILGPALADKVGRRSACLIASVLSLVSWILLSTVHSGWLILLARALTGFTDCLSVGVGFMYISEVSEFRNRGSLLNSCAMASGLGIALAYLVGGAVSWRSAGLFPPIISCCAIPVFVVIKESPVYLLKTKGDALESLQSYRTINTDKERSLVAKELEEMSGSAASSSQISLSQTAKQLLGRGGDRRPFVILLILFIVYPLCGMYSIAFFAIDLFQKLGLGSVQTVAVSSALIRVLGTALSSGLMARFGRRKLYIPACAVSSLSIGLVGALVKLREAGAVPDLLASWTMVIFIFIFMFAAGVAVVGFPWVLMAEWFPPELKSVVSGTLMSVQFAGIFISVQMTASMMALLGTGGLFLYFACICAANTIFVVLMVPETHGQTFSSLETLKMSSPPSPDIGGKTVSSIFTSKWYSSETHRQTLQSLDPTKLSL
jgi:MFS family permease